MLKSISIMLLGVLLLLAPSVQAITRRADKECLLCHVLWFDAFKTDQKTLVEQKDTAIVVAGSNGLVSTEAMCVTCHDGYVVDSRVSVEEGNPHHALKKPPESPDWPEILRLDSNNAIYCGTCHTLHDFKDSAEVGSTPFMRMDNDKSQMCIACHGDMSRKQADANHPVPTMIGDRARLKAAKKGAKFGPAREMICQSCHQAHGKRAMVTPLNNSALCLTCHQNKNSLLKSKHDFRSQLPDLTNIKQQKSGESGPCGACHIPHNAAGKKLWARPLPPGTPATQMCLSCHGPEAGIQAKRIGEHSHPVNVKPAGKGAVPKHLPLFLANATKTSSGRVQCFSCHDVHRWNPTAEIPAGESNTEGDGSNSFLRLANRESSALCVACHENKQQVLASDHNLSVTAPQEKNMLSMTAVQSGPCSACHVPHNATDNRLWARGRTSGSDDGIDRVCVSCHNDNGAARSKLIGDNDHPVNVSLKSLNLTATSMDTDQSLPLYKQDGFEENDKKMACMTCHDPHTWRPKIAAFTTKPYTANVEGTAADSFLRKSNYPSPDLCETCHLDRSHVEGTVHDLKVSAPKATNLLGQTVQSSGTCGTCHLVHNSPNKLRLWARDFGPVAENVNIIGALCTSCHSEGKAAEKKIPAIASHPAGKLITAHSGNTRGKVGYTPVFDKNGHKQNVGDIGCPSCHDGHLWNSGSQPPAGANAAQPARTSQFRFLRNQSFNTVCMECHGPEGLFRFLYFHDPIKRGIWTKPIFSLGSRRTEP